MNATLKSRCIPVERFNKKTGSSTRAITIIGSSTRGQPLASEASGPRSCSRPQTPRAHQQSAPSSSSAPAGSAGPAIRRYDHAHLQRRPSRSRQWPVNDVDDRHDDATDRITTDEAMPTTMPTTSHPTRTSGSPQTTSEWRSVGRCDDAELDRLRFERRQHMAAELGTSSRAKRPPPGGAGDSDGLTADMEIRNRVGKTIRRELVQQEERP